MKHQPVYMRHPDLSQNFFVFVSDDDLWRVNVSAEDLPNESDNKHVAFRLTTNSAHVRRPKISPKEDYIAYESTESGENEIYLIPSDGGVTRRLTFKGVYQLCGWTTDGHILVTSQYSRYGSLGLYKLTTEGEEVSIHEYGMLSAYHENSYGQVVARNPGDIAYWKEYKGGMVGEVWTKPKGQESFGRILTESRSHLCHVALKENSIYFISDRDGLGNIYETDFYGKNLRKIASSPPYYIRSFSIYSDKLLFMSGGQLWAQQLPSSAGSRPKKPKQLMISLPSSFEQARPRFVDVHKYLQSYAASYHGSQLMVVVRGALYTMKPWLGSSKHVALPPGFVRAREVFPFGAIKPDEGHKGTEGIEGTKDFLVIAVNEAGEDRLCHLKWDPKEQHYSSQVLFDQSLGKIWQLKAARNQSFVIFSTLRYELWHGDLNDGTLHLMAKCDGTVDDIDISADLQWVAFSAHNKLLQEIHLYHIPDKSSRLLFKGTQSESAPTFDLKEPLLYLFSQRNHQLISAPYPYFFSSLSQSLGYVLTLDKTTPSLMERWRSFPEDSSTEEVDKKADTDSKEGKNATDSEDSKAKDRKTKAADKTDEVPKDSPEPADNLDIDFRDMESRLEALPIKRAHWAAIFPTDDKIFFLEKRSTTHEFSVGDHRESYQLHSLTKSTGEVSSLDHVSDLEVTGDGKYFLAATSDELILCPIGEKIIDDDKDSKSRPKKIDLSRIRHRIDPKQEWDQMLVEALYLQKENLAHRESNTDFEAILTKYRALVRSVHTRSELSDLIWDMQGDLKTSHCYEYQGDYLRKPSHQPTGHLGAKLRYNPKTQSFRIESLLRGERWNAAARSPLLGPGVALEEGDEILKVDGQVFTSSLELDKYLDNRASTQLDLVVRRVSSKKTPADVAPKKSLATDKQVDNKTEKKDDRFFCSVKTLAKHWKLSYHDWVRKNREYVEEKSHHSVGYLHIPDMDQHGLTEFYKHYLKELDHQYLIVDVRYNQGGFVSEMIINHLASKAIAYTRGKWMTNSQTYPLYSAPQKIVCLINGYSCSDGDIFSHAFKDLSLGTLVGTRTWGGIIGIWPRISLMDGTFTSQPEYSFVFKKNQHVLENEGATPDITVEMSPDDWLSGKDPQLDAAIKQFKNQDD